MKVRILSTGLVLVLSACGGEAPTSSSATGPMYNGAYVIGSGNRSDTTSTTQTTAESGASAAGTYVIGSGN